MDFFQANQVVPVSGTIGQPLEADNAAQAGYEKFNSSEVGVHRPFLDRAVVKRWYAATDDVDDAGIGLRSEMGLVEEVLFLKRLVIAKAGAVEVYESRQDSPIVVGAVRDKEVDVLSRPYEAIGDNRKATDNHKVGVCGNHGGDRNV